MGQSIRGNLRIFSRVDGGMILLSFLKENFRWLIVGYLLMFCSSFGQTFYISIFGGEIREHFGLSHGDFGLIFTIVTLAGACLLSFYGGIVDRVCVSRVLAVSVPALALGTLLVGVAENLAVLVAGIFLLRLFGQGMMVHVAYTSAGKWFEAGRGRAVSIIALGLNSGQAVLPLISVMLAAALGWQFTWFAATFFLALVFPVVVWLSSRERKADSTIGTNSNPTVRNWTRSEVLKDKFFYLLLLGMLPPAFISNSIFFHQVHLAEIRNWQPEVFASSITMYAVVTVGSLMIAGQMIDRFSALKILPYYLLPFGAGCLVLYFSEAPISVFVFMVFYGVTDGFSLTLFGNLWPEVYGSKHLGAIRGVIVAIMVFASAIGPGISGLLIDAGVGFPFQIGLMGSYCILIGPILWLVVNSLHRRSADHSTANTVRRA